MFIFFPGRFPDIIFVNLDPRLNVKMSKQWVSLCEDLVFNPVFLYNIIMVLIANDI